MKWDLGKSKLIAAVLIGLGLFVLGSNTYNSPKYLVIACSNHSYLQRLHP